MASELRRFYIAKEKAGLNGPYGYDTDGNLVQRDKNGTIINTITLPTYRRPTEEEYDMMEKTHRDAIAIAEREVDNARSALYEMSQNPERDDATIFHLNRMVGDAESKLVVTRFPLMRVNIIYPDSKSEKIVIKQLDFTQPNNDRRVPYNIGILETRPFTLQEQYVRVGENPEKPMVSVAEVKERIKAAEVAPVIVFEGTASDDYGYLSMDWAIMIEFNSTMYRSAKQAVYAELAKFFNDQVNLPQLLTAETADEVNYSVEDVPGENNIDKWNAQLRKLIYDVNVAKFKQYPELAAKLLETKNAILGAYLPGDMMIGTGISIESADAKDSSKWGENILGKALMSIRDTLKTEKPVMMEPVVEAPVPAPRKKSMGKPKVGSIAPPVEIAVEEVAEEPIQLEQVPSAAIAAPITAPMAAPIAAPMAAPITATKRKPRVGVRPSVAPPS